MQPYPDEPTVIVPATRRVAATYAEAGHAYNPEMGVHTTRMTYDYCAGMSWDASEAKHLRELREQLGLPVIPTPSPSVPPPGELPLLRCRGTQFVDAKTDQPWKWRGVSAFRLFDEWQMGNDIVPYCQWALVNNINILRVFGMYAGALGRLIPDEIDRYFYKVRDFLNVMESYGLSLEWVAFADLQRPGLDHLDVQRHYHNLVDVLLGREGVVLEICNEPPLNGLDPTTVYTRFGELAQALGLYNPENNTLPVAQYLTDHTPRDDEWPRKAKDILELTKLGAGSMPPLMVPGICDEPMGIGVDQPGRRSMSKPDMAQYHALAALFGSGSTIHGDFGIECRLPNADEQAVVDAITMSWSAVPEPCQLWEYTAGHLDWCPLENHALREYGMMLGNLATMVRIRPDGPPVARNGWRIVNQTGYQGCVVELTR